MNNNIYEDYNLDLSISIVIGLHNKEEDIKNTILSIYNKIKIADLQLIIVENGSTDSSYEIASKLKSELKRPNFEFLLLRSKKGLGNALKKGVSFASNEYIYILPADLALGFSELDHISKNNIDNFDFLLGSKGHKDSVVNRKYSRKLFSILFNLLQKLILSINFSDTQGTMIFKSKIIKNEKLFTEKFLITTELVLIALHNNYKIEEVPVFERQQQSKSTVNPLRDGFEMLKGLFVLRKIYISNA